jgi:hypothetical protein
MPPQIRRIPGLPRDKDIWVGPPSAGKAMSTAELLSPVWINLRLEGYGVVIQDHQNQEQLWDLQPGDNPHQVSWTEAYRLLSRGDATLATEADVRKAVASRAKDPAWADHPGRSRTWTAPVRPLDGAMPPHERMARG